MPASNHVPGCFDTLQLRERPTRLTILNLATLDEHTTALAREIYIGFVSISSPTSSEFSFQHVAERSFAAALAFYETAAATFPGNKSQDRTDSAKGIFRGIHGTEPREVEPKS